LNQLLRVFLLTILSGILIQGISLTAFAATGDTFTPYVFATMTHDSNLLCLSPSAITTNPADFIRQTGAGMDVDWKVARQEILLTAAINENRFDRYSVLNYQGRDLKARWNWQWADHLRGDAGYINNVTLGSFANQQTLVGNQRLLQRSFFDGLWSFHPSWQAGIGVSRNIYSFADIQQSYLNSDTDVWETTLQYLSSTTSKIGLKLRETNGYYPNQAIDYVTMVDNGYQQREILATLDWNDGGHNLFKGQAGSVQRNDDHFSVRDYNGFNARGTYTWLPTGKVRLDISAWHEISAYEDLTTSYSLNRGISLMPSWTPVATITVSGNIQRVSSDFLGDPGIVVITTNRKDTTDTRQLSVNYQPAPSYSFNASVGSIIRNSNQPQFSFDSYTISIGATFQM
jgi:exopolysaccharide biosynthesis operon protein EpsL